MAGVPGGGSGRCRAHSRRGRRRDAALCGGYAGEAAVGDCGEWERKVSLSTKKNSKICSLFRRPFDQSNANIVADCLESGGVEVSWILFEL